MFSPSDIRGIEFETQKRGYNIDDVRAFLGQIAQQIDQLNAEKTENEQNLLVLADKIEEYRKDEDSLRLALLNAQKLSASIQQEAKQKAEVMVRDATIKSEDMISEATAQSENMIREATEKAEALIAEAVGKVENEKAVFAQLKEEVAKFKAEILSLYKSHLDVLSLLKVSAEEDEPLDYPEVETEEAAPVAEAVEEPVVEAVEEPVVEAVEEVAEEAVEEIAEPVAEAVEEAVEEVGETVAEVAEAVEETAEEADALKDNFFADLEEKAEDVAEAVEEAAEDAEEKHTSKFGKLDFGDVFSFNV